MDHHPDLSPDRLRRLQRSQPLANAVVLIVSLLLLFPLTVVFLRMFVRIRIAKKVGIDDYLVIVATVLSVGVSIASGYESKLGVLNRAGLKAGIALHLLFFTSTWALKMSVCCWCHEIFGRVISRRQNFLIWAAMSIVSSIWAISFGTLIFSCSPVSSLWNPRKLLQGDGCVNVSAAQLVLAIVNAISDWLVMYLPLALIKHSELNSRQKKYITGILSLAFLAVLASISRVVSYGIIVSRVRTPQAMMWIMLPLSTAFELNIAIAASSLPSLSPLFRSAKQKFGRNSGGKPEVEPEFGQPIYFDDKGLDFGFAEWDSGEVEKGLGLGSGKAGKEGKGGGITVRTSYVVERSSPSFSVKVFSPKRWADRHAGRTGGSGQPCGNDNAPSMSKRHVMKPQPALPAAVRIQPTISTLYRTEAKEPVLMERRSSLLEILRQGPPHGMEDYGSPRGKGGMVLGV
ncbi:hypothetical protein FKW77_010593 [Venturia effusa]|uniref:Rhodopsin domain-containing protein n=1 Tax=Venturia effusa TaxID=50376 RepID=A0A517KXX7_9PEZI|nr:hypothetical protein FKW77_010593 [Venturia effusa]